jgi:hypothetical protein
MRPVSGLAILSLNPSLQMKLTDDYAAGNTDAHKSSVDERYRLFASTINSPSQVRIVSNCEQAHHGCQAYKVTEDGVGSIKDLG